MSLSTVKKQTDVVFKDIIPEPIIKNESYNKNNIDISTNNRDLLTANKLAQSTGTLDRAYTRSFISPQLMVNSEEDTVTATLKGSLKIMEKIQRDFENCARNNNIDRNFSSFVIPHNKDSRLYSYVSDYEKQMINTQIEETSDQRIKNYSHLFSIINSSLKDIKDSLLNYSDKKGNFNFNK
jgi:hypothetical protein